jgi:hypothetical protein
MKETIEDFRLMEKEAQETNLKFLRKRQQIK